MHQNTETTIPANSLLVRGTCIVNEAMFSGESTPLLKGSIKLWGAGARLDLLEGHLSSGLGPAPQEPLPATLASSEHHSRGRQRKVQTRAQETLRSWATKSTRRKASGSFSRLNKIYYAFTSRYFPSTHLIHRRACACRCAFIALAVPSTPCSHVPHPTSQICFTAHPHFLPHRIRIIKP